MNASYSFSGMKTESANLSEAEWLRRAAKGDEAAFTELYRRHNRAVFRFALYMSGRKEIAEEITQDVFLMLIRNPRQYSADRGSLQAFLIGITRNKVRRCMEQLQGVVPDSDTAGREPGYDPFESCAKKHDLQALKSAISSLPPRYREVIVLCELEEMDYTDAARVLECAIGTVRSRLHRARGILGAKLHARERCSV